MPLLPLGKWDAYFRAYVSLGKCGVLNARAHSLTSLRIWREVFHGVKLSHVTYALQKLNLEVLIVDRFLPADNVSFHFQA